MPRFSADLIAELDDMKVFTSGQAAKICKVAPRTVSKWIDSGRIPGSYRIPGSQDRRIPKDALIAFLKNNGMPIPKALENSGKIVILTVGLDSDTRAQFLDGEHTLFVHTDDTVQAALDGVPAMPKVVIIDPAAFGDIETGTFIARLKKRMPVFCIVLTKGEFKGADLTAQKPIDPETLLQHLRVVA